MKKQKENRASIRRVRKQKKMGKWEESKENDRKEGKQNESMGYNNMYHKNLRIILHLFQSCRALSDRGDEMWILYRHPGESLWLRPRSLPCAWYGGIWLAENIPTTCVCHRIRNAPGCPGQPQQGCGQSLLLCQRPQLWGVSLGCSQIVLCYS